MEVTKQLIFELFPCFVRGHPACRHCLFISHEDVGTRKGFNIFATERGVTLRGEILELDEDQINDLCIELRTACAEVEKIKKAIETGCDLNFFGRNPDDDILDLD